MPKIRKEIPNASPDLKVYLITGGDLSGFHFLTSWQSKDSFHAQARLLKNTLELKDSFPLTHSLVNGSRDF